MMASSLIRLLAVLVVARADEPPRADCVGQEALDTPAGVTALSSNAAARTAACSARQSVDALEHRDPDAVSMLQSRGVRIDHADDTDSLASKSAGSALPPPPPPPPHRPKANLLFDSGIVFMREHSAVGAAPIVSFILVILLLVCCCWAACFLVKSFRQRKEQDLLETRVTSVLQRQDVGEETKAHEQLPAGKLGTAGASPLWPMRSPAASRQSPLSGSPLTPRGLVASTQAAAGRNAAQDTALPFDMPPPLTKSGAQLPSEAHLVVKKGALSAASKGGELLFSTPGGAPMMRASIRKVDADLYLEVAPHEDGSAPCAMVRLTHEDASTPVWPASKPTSGPELFGPEGDFYGTFEKSSMATNLIYSTSALPVLRIEGDPKNARLFARTKSGAELARVTCSGPSASSNIELCVNRGSELALILASVLAVLLKA